MKVTYPTRTGMTVRSKIFLGVLWIMVTSTAIPQVIRRPDPLDFELVRQGFSMKLYLDAAGMHGRAAAFWRGLDLSVSGMEYPINSGTELLTSAGLSIGALVDNGRPGSPRYVKYVSDFSIRNNVPGFIHMESKPVDSLHQWYSTSTEIQNMPNLRFVDDDTDGKIDEDVLDGVDNDLDGSTDEDYGAISEQDFYCAYADTTPIYSTDPFFTHSPIGIKVWQRSYAWDKKLRAPILPIDYSVVNISGKILKRVYLAINAYPRVMLEYDPDTWGFDYGRYWPDLKTFYVQNGSRTISPFGIVILAAPDSYKVHWKFGLNLATNAQLYDLMSGEAYSEPPSLFSPDQNPSPGLSASAQLIFGPLEEWLPGDTIKLSLAYISGDDVEYSPNSLRENARLAHTLYQRNYIPPVVLPSPELNITPDFRRVTLRWGWSGRGVDPTQVWDDASTFADLYPPDHWRRRYPPQGSVTGGRIFEGYRLYRSESPFANKESFTLLKQWDVIDSVGPQFEYDVGLDSQFTDEGLGVNKTYWYTVTSFGLPDLHTIDYLDRDGSVKQTRLLSKGAESSRLASRKRINLPFSVSEQLGEVLVVPNPYRTDADYTLESGGWEGRSRSWNENKRLLKFIHLPEKCTIRIFSLSGDVIATLEHENDTRGEMSWNMLSESGRTIASGIYVYTVESEHGTQRGKFVVIR